MGSADNETIIALYTNAPLAARRKSISDFVDYALSKPEVRMVSPKQLMIWMSNPSPLQ